MCNVCAMSLPRTATEYADESWLRSDTAASLLKRVGHLLYDNMSASERHQNSRFFGGPAASDKSRRFLASVLRTAGDTELRNDVRAYFNTLHAGGDHVTQADVSCAIRLLKGE